MKKDYLNKFEAKKTTDDCYTPKKVINIVINKDYLVFTVGIYFSVIILSITAIVFLIGCGPARSPKSPWQAKAEILEVQLKNCEQKVMDCAEDWLK